MGQYFRRGGHHIRRSRHSHGRFNALVTVATLITRHGERLGVSMAALA